MALGIDDLFYLARQALDGNSGAAKVLMREEGLDAAGALKKAESMTKSPSLLDDAVDNVDLSYRGSHKAPDADYGAPLHDLTDIIPDDIYGAQGKRLYGIGDPAIDRETFDVLNAVRGMPDAEVDIYRAVPKGVKDINAGDWVTTSPSYAKMHGESALGGDYDVIKSKAPAKKLQSEGYPYEFGLLPALGALTVGLTGTDEAMADSALPVAVQAAGQIDMSNKPNIGRDAGTLIGLLDILAPLLTETVKPQLMGNADLTDEQRKRGYFKQGLL